MSVTKLKLAAVALAGLTLSGAAYADSMMAGGKADPMVGGKAMYPTKTIVQNASAAPNLTTLVAAVKAAGLVDTLSGKGPFTVFAPTNDAFSALPAGTVDTLLKPENKDKLTKILTYHVVPGMYDSAKLMQLVKDGDGTATLKTVEGDSLTFKQDGSSLTVTDDKDNTATVTTADVTQSNGEVHVIDKVLMP